MRYVWRGCVVECKAYEIASEHGIRDILSAVMRTIDEGDPRRLKFRTEREGLGGCGRARENIGTGICVSAKIGTGMRRIG